jgi:hypothetical protein
MPFSVDAQRGFSAMPTPSSVEASLTYPAVADATLGRYRLFAKPGSGGQADVFLAIARGTLGVDKLVVIKRARAEVAGDAAQLGIFVNDARLRGSACTATSPRSTTVASPTVLRTAIPR